MQRDTLDIRDSVLNRVVSYLDARRMDTLWIDTACIDLALIKPMQTKKLKR